MNRWTKLSIEYANQRSYLDDLFQVYPTIPEGIRDIDENIWSEIEKAFIRKNNQALIRNLFKLDLFPIKDSYIAFLKKDNSAIDRNPKTVNRLCGRLYEMGLDEIYERCSEPKETNRQIGPMFKNWLDKKALGVASVSLEKFLSDFGGSQNSDFEDAIRTLEAKDANAFRIAILDGILYLKGKSKIHNFITNPYKDYKIMSALVLREFLYQL